MNPLNEFIIHPERGRNEDPLGWWGRYREMCRKTLSPTAMQVLQADARYVVDRCVLGAGPPGEGEGWSRSRSRQGIVMGAVQSGKTASMLAVSAMSLDRGVDLVIILAGTRLSLWRQTYDRVVDQLGVAGAARDCVLAPRSTPEQGYPGGAGAAYARPEPFLRRAVSQRRPMVVVALKEVHHLIGLAEMLQQRLRPAVDNLDRPFHMLVLDDEADDGSVLDARGEALGGPDRAQKQIPRAIVRLWQGWQESETTWSENLYATYAGYTATPQANFLQEAVNPLAPRDFVAALRTPLDEGQLEPRTATFLEPRGRSAYYTGGEVFYRRCASELVVPTDLPGKALPDPLGSAVRAFLVAGAVKLWRHNHRVDAGAAPAQTAVPSTAELFDTEAEARRRSLPVHSMLVHPSGLVADHFDTADEIVRWSCRGKASTGGSDRRALSVSGLASEIEADPDLWSSWLGSYVASRTRVDAELGQVPDGPRPTQDDWPALRQLLLEQVIPATRVSVINGDAEADDRPRFRPEQTADGRWTSAPDQSTIFVSGNVMARGLTLEGLTTTAFSRSSDNPLADTQMQMQRWFGYRGADLELCRVFMTAAQQQLFSQYHDNDEALRREVISLMEAQAAAPSPLVLQGRTFDATGKITNVSSVPLAPGPAPFLARINTGAEPNVDVVRRLLLRDHHPVLGQETGGPLGLLLDQPLTLLEAADLLDQLRFTDYHPAPDGWQGRRWRAVAAHAGLQGSPEAPLYRPPTGSAGTTEDSLDCPYAWAAYLRLWAASTKRRARGLLDSATGQPWWSVDLARKGAAQPRIHVGLRFGRGDAVEIDGIAVRPMDRAVEGGRLISRWGSRGGGETYPGDLYFDYHDRGERAPGLASGDTVWRPEGAPGLLLIHPISRPGGKVAIAVAMAMPLGGPEQFAAATGAPR